MSPNEAVKREIRRSRARAKGEARATKDDCGGDASFSFLSFFFSHTSSPLPYLNPLPKPDKMFKKSKEREDEAKRNVSGLSSETEREREKEKKERKRKRERRR